MQANLQIHTQIVQNFKDRVLDSVAKKQFEEKSLDRILKDTFGKKNVEVFYDDDYLNRYKLEASHVFDGKSNFILKEDSFDCIGKKNLEELKQEGLLTKFADFYDSITHEFSHGVYEKNNQKKMEFLTDNLNKFLKKPEDADKMIDINFNLTQKTLELKYEKPEQISRAIEYQANKLSSDKKVFGKFMHLNLLDSLKDETVAYIEGFKAKRDILGDKARFDIGLSFDEAMNLIKNSLHMAREAYLNKYMPIKKLNRYF